MDRRRAGRRRRRRFWLLGLARARGEPGARAARRRAGRAGGARRAAGRARPAGAGPDASRPSASARRRRSPKFKAAADAYPSTDAGIFARYREAATLDGARQRRRRRPTAYQQVIDRPATASTARWRGWASPRRRRAAGQYEQAINTFKELAQRKDGPLPVDGILMQLGRDLPRRRQAQRRAADLQSRSSRSSRTRRSARDAQNASSTA